ncbi:MAG: ribonuclease P protein component [Planctomycetes bacterium]|nr:ribonuclease P protein component [Planctomycetota bacterium]
MPMHDLPKRERLRGRERVGMLFREGYRGSAGKVTVRALVNGDATSRIAAVAGKKLGCAVVRNRLRRVLRAAWRLQKHRLPPGWDFALVARPGLMEATWAEVERDVAMAVERAVRAASAFPRPGRPE